VRRTALHQAPRRCSPASAAFPSDKVYRRDDHCGAERMVLNFREFNKGTPID
jgi:hypothetical protein